MNEILFYYYFAPDQSDWLTHLSNTSIRWNLFISKSNL